MIEADEYDTAFFDKRAKFVHYRPRHLLLTNLEYDHADIYPDLASIQRQFHHLVRTVPPSGRIAWNAGDANLAATLAMGAWTPLVGYAREQAAEWRARLAAPDGSAFEVLHAGCAGRHRALAADRGAQRRERALGRRLRQPAWACRRGRPAKRSGASPA